MARSTGIPQRMRNDGSLSPSNANSWQHTLTHHPPTTESWVEISSRPSSSSLSSVGDDIVTTGLRVQQQQQAPNSHQRRRRIHHHPNNNNNTTTTTSQHQQSLHRQRESSSASSQEEYEESESEEDHILTSSNEHLHILPSASTQEIYDAGSSSDSDDDEATALGSRRPILTGGEERFTPQPNAFSHPPQSTSYFPRQQSSTYHHHQRPNSYPSRTNSHPYGRNAQVHQADHDAALRASLTTLLSCAAAARGLPKHTNHNQTVSNEPIGLRMVPESELFAGNTTLPVPAANTSRPLTPATHALRSPSVSSEKPMTGEGGKDEREKERGKRKAAAGQSKNPSRALKKKRGEVGAEEGNGVQGMLISPTFLTWVMSAGVVVLVSVVGFGAGYVIGREVGRGEALSGLNGGGIAGGDVVRDCGREVVRSGTAGGGGGLRKFRWGTGVARSIVA